ncbi:MAG: hypothetical protein IPI10_19355 [Bacteroidetes bacterium]|nr:hypothetical protein [Bacteroidota bacterium]
MKAGESENSCSQWLNATPSFFELDPGATQKVQVLLQVPASPKAKQSKMGCNADQTCKREKVLMAAIKTQSFGIAETFQFVVHVFQSPPTVVDKSAELISFREISTPTDSTRVLASKEQW